MEKYDALGLLAQVEILGLATWSCGIVKPNPGGSSLMVKQL